MSWLLAAGILFIKCSLSVGEIDPKKEDKFAIKGFASKLRCRKRGREKEKNGEAKKMSSKLALSFRQNPSTLNSGS